VRCHRANTFLEVDPRWNFLTNDIYWAGRAQIPCIGFGPGDEEYAHTALEQVPLEEVVRATEFYTLFPAMLKEHA